MTLKEFYSYIYELHRNGYLVKNGWNHKTRSDTYGFIKDISKKIHGNPKYFMLYAGNWLLPANLENNDWRWTGKTCRMFDVRTDLLKQFIQRYEDERNSITPVDELVF